MMSVLEKRDRMEAMEKGKEISVTRDRIKVEFKGLLLDAFKKKNNSTQKLFCT